MQPLIRTRSRNVAKRVSTRKALLGGNIDIIVNDYTNQLIRSTTAQYHIFNEQSLINALFLMQLCTIETKRQCVTTNNDGSDQNKPRKQSNRKVDKYDLQSTFSISLLYSPIRFNQHNKQQTMGSKKDERCLLQARIEQRQARQSENYICEDEIGHTVRKINEYVNDIIQHFRSRKNNTESTEIIL